MRERQKPFQSFPEEKYPTECVEHRCVIYTPHARTRMHERNIPMSLVEVALWDTESSIDYNQNDYRIKIQSDRYQLVCVGMLVPKLKFNKTMMHFFLLTSYFTTRDELSFFEEYEIEKEAQFENNSLEDELDKYYDDIQFVETRDLARWRGAHSHFK